MSAVPNAPQNCKVYAFANQKGGVGKTTCCVNLSASLASYGKKVLVLDLDPQGNATMASGVDKTDLKYSMNDLLQQEASFADVVVKNTPAGYDLIPANSDLTAAEAVLVKKVKEQITLAPALKAAKDDYDYIFLDCPPSLSMLTINGLAASDAVIVAMQCEYFALEGISDLLNTVSQLQATVNPMLHISGIVRTMYDGRNKLATEVSKQLIKHFGNRVFQTVIPRNVRLAEAPSYGLPVYLYDKNSRGSTAYLALAQEFLNRHQEACGNQAGTKASSEAAKLEPELA